MNINPYRSPQESHNRWPLTLRVPRDFIPWFLVALAVLAFAVVIVNQIGVAKAKRKARIAYPAAR
jgi:hypothetical protein